MSACCQSPCPPSEPRAQTASSDTLRVMPLSCCSQSTSAATWRVDEACCTCSGCGEPCIPLRSASPGVVSACCSCAAPAALICCDVAVRPAVFEPFLPLREGDIIERIADECFASAVTRGITMLKYPPPAQQQTVGGASTAVAATPQVMHAPMTLLPMPVHTELYEHLRSLAPHFSLLYDRIGRDTAWLRATLAPAAATDPFTARLLAMLVRIDESRATSAFPPQSLSLGISRSDYMLHDESCNEGQGECGVNCVPTSQPGANGAVRCLSHKQVEYNTISAGANSLSQRVGELHRAIVTRYDGDKKHHLPPNEPIEHIVAAMAHAVRLFVEQQALVAAASSAPLVLFVVQAREANLADQRALELALFEQHGVDVRRMTLSQVYQQTRMDSQTGRLYVNATSHEQERLVALVYFRAAYTPRDFTSGSVASDVGDPSSASFPVNEEGEEGASEWDALERLHRSVAIKCPSLGFHLAGAKMVQQVLTVPGVLERFEPSAAVCRALRSVCVRMYPVNADSAAAALANPHRFVLKPQREGGGSNLWGQAMTKELRDKSAEQLQDYILMDVIGASPVTAAVAAADVDSRSGSSLTQFSPPVHQSATVLRDVPTLKGGQLMWDRRAIAELGLVGCIITGDVGSTHDHVVMDDASTLGASGVGGAGSAAVQVYRNEYAGYLLRIKSAEMTEGGLMSGAGAIGSLVLQ